MLDSRPQSQRWPEALILLATSVLFGIKDLFSFLTTAEFGGRDLASNYAFTLLMQQNLLHGEIFSWTNQWLLGFPSFQLYPPVFFLFTSILDLITGQILSIQFWFKAAVFLSVFLIPVLTYHMTDKVFGRVEAFFAGFYMLYFIFVYPPISQAYQVFSVGLVAQGFAFLLIIGSIGFMLRDGRKNKFISGLLLGLAALSHPFVAIAGFLVSFSLTLTDQKLKNLLPAAIGSLIVGPWMINAAKYLPYAATYTFEPANTGFFLYLLLPLIFIGGYQGAKRRALLITFSALLVLSITEIPLVTQELRFYTYSLGIGSILAGLGAFRVFEYLDEEFEADKRLIAVLLLIPVISLSLHADLSQSWSFEGETEPIYEKLDSMEKGRVLVETSNSSIFDSFVLQGKIPVETEHWAVNDVHLDSSTSANYILTLESLVSEEPVYSPICQTCNASIPSSLLDKRLDDLGIRYVIVRTESSQKKLQEVLEYQGKYGEYWLFENTENHQIVEPLENEPVELVGSYDKWLKVNNLLFTENISKEIVWSKTGSDQDRTTIYMGNLSIEEIVNTIEDAETEPIAQREISYTVEDRSIKVNSSIPVKIKISYFPISEDIMAGKFNTVVKTQGRDLTLP